jgi:hypothetical protein
MWRFNEHKELMRLFVVVRDCTTSPFLVAYLCIGFAEYYNSFLRMSHFHVLRHTTRGTAIQQKT